MDQVSPYALSGVSESIDHAAEFADALDRFAREWGPDEVLWAALPQIHLIARSTLDEPHLTASKRPLELRDRLEKVLRHSAPGHGPELFSLDKCLFVSTSIQHRRVIDPVIATISAGRPAPVASSHLAPPSLRAVYTVVSHARHIARSLYQFLYRDGLILREEAYEAVLQASLLTLRARRTLQLHRPRLLVIATQHGNAVRAVLSAANQLAIPSVYVPHAPVADNRFYRDLPVSVALLRGPREVDFYVSSGAARNRLDVVGDPMIQPHHPVPSHQNGTLLYAPSPHSERLLKSQVRLIEEGAPGDVEVSPHPRMDGEALSRMCPANWTLAVRTSTYERMVSGTISAVVLANSGVGLEALYLGLPVVDLHHPGSNERYPYLLDAEVVSIRDSSGLERACAELVHSPHAATSRRLYSRSWRVKEGPEAATGIAHSLAMHATSLEWSPPILDGWAERSSWPWLPDSGVPGTRRDVAD